MVARLRWLCRATRQRVGRPRRDVVDGHLRAVEADLGVAGRGLQLEPDLAVPAQTRPVAPVMSGELEPSEPTGSGGRMNCTRAVTPWTGAAVAAW